MNTVEENILRDASPNEILYSHFQDLYTTFSIQFIVEGKGEIYREAFCEAVRKASEKCPGARGVLKNGKWIDSGITPKITYLEDVEFDGYNFSKSEIFREKINFNQEPAAEVFVINSEPYRMIFRVFHGAMDGKGALIWVGNIFKALRDEVLIEAKSKETDLTFLKSSKPKKFKMNLNFEHKILKGKNMPQKFEVYWKRLTIPGAYHGLVARIAKVLTDKFEDERNKFLIPVDIRRHNREIVSTANLTLPIFLETDKRNTWEEINGNLLRSLKNSRELNLSSADFDWFTRLPGYLIRTAARAATGLQKFTGKYMVGGIISHLGKLDLKDFSTKDFLAECFFSMPIQHPLVPISLVAVETGKSTEVVVAAYKSFIPEDVCEEILSSIDSFLTRESVYEEINQTGKDYDYKKNVIDLFREYVESSPHTIALICDKQYMTYRELDKKSDALAGVLKQKGIRSSGYVMLYLNRSFELIISIIAILKAGAAYVPIDISYPIEKVKDILNSDNITALISERMFEERLEEFPIRDVVLVDDIDFSRDIKCQENCIKPGDVIYQIFTSGSTGNPKGVQIEGKSLMNYLYWAKEEYKVSRSSRFPLFTSIAADLTITSIFLPLISGGSVEIFGENTNHWVLKQILLNDKIDCIKLTPTHLRLILSLNLTPVNKKLLVVGGEQFDAKLARDVQKLFGENCRIVNEYGPTEATIGCVFHSYNEMDCDETAVPIGLPIDNTKVLLLDENQKIVKPGEIGEIYILGDCLARGYSNNDELNLKRFVYVKGERAYKTGDLAKLNHRNQYVYLGRNDNQIKIAGYRIEAGEIEAEISSFEGIENAIVIGSNLESESQYLKAYFTAKIKIDIYKLKEHLRKRLPVYMIPKYFLHIDDIPMSQSGKLAVELLPEINTETDNEIVGCNIDLNHEQMRLRKIWCRTLKIEESKIGLNDDFYDLGGDSVSLIKMLSDMANDIDGLENEEKVMKCISVLHGNITINNLVKAFLRN